MLLADLQKIAAYGAQMPLIFWLPELKAQGGKIVPKIKKVTKKLHDGTTAKTEMEKLIQLFQTGETNELELAKTLLFIAEIFRTESTIKHQYLVKQYTENCLTFFHSAQKNLFHQLEREKNKQFLSLEEQKKHDHKLFQNEGMMFCLEYYLALYRAATDAPTTEEKKKYVEQKEVNLGLGNVPGIWIDFSRDEVLEKFIYKILDDSTRNSLVKVYFQTKATIMKIKIVYSDKASISSDWTNVTIDEVLSIFKNLIHILLKTFQKNGIHQLASYFFAPYGKQPLIKDIKL